LAHSRSIVDADVVTDRKAVVEFLSSMGAAAQKHGVAALGGLLACGDPAVLDDVLDCLAGLGPVARAALPALDRVLQSDDPRLRARASMAVVAIEGQASPRSLMLLVRVIRDPTLELEMRDNAVAVIRAVNAAALAKATPELIRQLGRSKSDVPTNAVSRLGMIVEETRAEIPTSTNDP
jgi:HEAT repeat protein